MNEALSEVTRYSDDVVRC